MSTTSIPPITDPRWNDIVTGRKTKTWEMLAIKIMMTRILTSTKNDPSTTNIERCISEVHAFFEKNLSLAQNDLEGLF